MIDRRLFLKGICGAGLGLHPLMNIKTSADSHQRSKYAAEFYYPDLTLIVKVYGVRDSPETRESFVSGRCFFGGDVWPIDVYFYGDDKPVDILIGNIYIMTSQYYLFEIEHGICLTHKVYQPIESVLSTQEIRKVESDFMNIGLFEKVF